MVSYPHGPAKEDVCPFCLRYTWLGACDGVRVRLEYSPVTPLGELAALTLNDRVLSYHLNGQYIIFRFPESLDLEAPVHMEHRCALDDRSPLVLPYEAVHPEPEEPPF